MLNQKNAHDVIGTTAYSSDGDKIGKVGQLYLDDQTGGPQFVSVNTGLFGTNESLVPVTDADLDGDRLTVPFDKEKVKGAPNVGVDDGHLAESDEDLLYDYYGLGQQSTSGTTDGFTDGTTDGSSDGRADGYPTGTTDADEHRGTGLETGSGTGLSAGTGTSTGGPNGAGHDVSGPSTDEAMTRSEEHLEVGTARRESGRARLRKYVTTEQETVSVPVQRERAVLETEPITDANVGDAHDGPAISEEEHEVVLTEDQVVVTTEAKPVERVRLGTETVTDEETVTQDVRKEHVEVDGDVDDRRS